VFLTYVSVKGRALIDRELYPPTSWTDDRERCAEAGIDEETEFATQPAPAQRMLEPLLYFGAAVGWFTADEAYGDNNPGLRAWLETTTSTTSWPCPVTPRLLPRPARRGQMNWLVAHHARAGSASRPVKAAKVTVCCRHLYDWL
jgi:hypothetical protein